MNKENYILQVSRRLHCESARKKEITDQLYSDIESALEQGEEWEDIKRRLGTPDEMAAELNENLSDGSPQASSVPSRRKTIGIAVGILLLLCLLLIPVAVYQEQGTDSSATATPSATNRTWPVSDEEATALANSVLKNYNSENYTAITSLCNDKMKSGLTQTVLQKTKKEYLADAGSYQKTKNTSITYTKEQGAYYTVVQLLTAYEKQQVIFTITWDENKRLAGFYIR